MRQVYTFEARILVLSDQCVGTFCNLYGLDLTGLQDEQDKTDPVYPVILSFLMDEPRNRRTVYGFH